jgi:hypothetical protein
VVLFERKLKFVFDFSEGGDVRYLLALVLFAFFLYLWLVNNPVFFGENLASIRGTLGFVFLVLSYLTFRGN